MRVDVIRSSWPLAVLFSALCAQAAPVRVIGQRGPANMVGTPGGPEIVPATQLGDEEALAGTADPPHVPELSTAPVRVLAPPAAPAAPAPGGPKKTTQKSVPTRVIRLPEEPAPVRPGGLTASMRYDTTAISAYDPSTDDDADLRTSYDARVQVAWAKRWSEAWASRLVGQLRLVDFEPNEVTAKELVDREQNLHGAKVQVEHGFSPSFSLGIGAGYQQQLFVKAPTADRVALAPLLIPEAGLSARMRVMDAGKTSVWLNLAGDYLASAQGDGFKAKPGHAYQAGLAMRRMAAEGRFVEVEAGYLERSQDSDVVKLAERSVWARVNFDIALFEGGR